MPYSNPNATVGICGATVDDLAKTKPVSVCIAQNNTKDYTLFIHGYSQSIIMLLLNMFYVN